ncbi:MAG TPA: putative peptidoglycan glycosyltransferase FtsW [Candidatus Paceibacterota bacterium]|nr:putative peptidoglycan glycosyltransferase FtsW [Candidatus Paceibacterota bacterium]HPT40225.1 putative peptidoglycan glycosyltransferase FtsW [Candidatus Paceibacterota bacterium]
MKFKVDISFVTIVAVLTVIGFAVLLSASFIMSKNDFNDPYYYLKHQLLLGGVFGVIGAVITSFIYYRYWEKFSLVIMLLAIAGMILVFTPLGMELNGARRWVQIGSFNFQPSELLKVASIIYLSAWISKRGKKINSWSEGYLPLLFLLVVIFVLFFFQKSMSTTIITIVSLGAIYFLSKVKMRFVFASAAIAIVGFGLFMLLGGHQMTRVMSFLGTGDQTETRDYHINQALIAIGSGGLTGVGYNNAVSKYSFLPEPMGDSIFAVIAQEFGFLGSSLIIGLYILLFLKGMKIAKNSPDKFSQLVVSGLIVMVTIQAFVNIAAMCKLIPLTGQPLPFMSYGGTNLAVLLTSMGIIANISKYTRKV